MPWLCPEGSGAVSFAFFSRIVCATRQSCCPAGSPAAMPPAGRSFAEGYLTSDDVAARARPLSLRTTICSASRGRRRIRMLAHSGSRMRGIARDETDRVAATAGPVQ